MSGQELEVVRRPHLTTGALVREREWAILAQIGNTIVNTEFVPRGLRGNKPAVMACLLYGREQGLGPMTALSEISVVDGRPTMSAALMNAKIREAGHRMKVDTIHDAEGACVGATAYLWRLDEQFEVEHSFTFTIADAKLAGLTDKPNWKKYPKAMYGARAVSGLARQAAPDVFIGSVYTGEEMDPDVEWSEDGVRETPVLVGAGNAGQTLDEAGTVDDVPAEDSVGEGADDPVEEAAPAAGEPTDQEPGTEAPVPAPTDEPGLLDPAHWEWSGTVYDLGPYDSMNVEQVTEHLPNLTTDRLLFIEQYEAGKIEGAGGRDRKTVLRKVDQLVTDRQAQAGYTGEVVEGEVVEPDEPAETMPEDSMPDADEPEPAFSFTTLAPEETRPKVEQTREAAARAAEADPRWTEASVWSTATTAFNKPEPVTSWAALSDAELESIYTAIPAEFK